MTAKKPLSPWQSELPKELPHHIRRNICKGDGGCWLWIRSKSRDGYGWASLDDKTYQAHRLVYEIIVGKQDLPLDHICRVRHCVNPAHLEPVTPAENNKRSPISTTGRKKCLKCGGEFSIVGRKTPQRRCLACLEKYRREKSEDRRLRDPSCAGE